MSRGFRSELLAVGALAASVSSLHSQTTTLPPPAPGMAIRWNDPRTGSHEGTITAITPTGVFVVDEKIDHWDTIHGLTVEPAAARNIKVRVVHVSHRGVGGLLGMVGGGVIAADMISSNAGAGTCSGTLSYCLGLPKLGSAIGSAAAELAIGMTAGALIGSTIGGSRTVWAPVGAPAQPVAPKGISFRPLVTWHNGPALGVQLKF